MIKKLAIGACLSVIAIIIVLAISNSPIDESMISQAISVDALYKPENNTIEITYADVSEKTDSVIIETKASGIPLTQELRRQGIPINTFSPSKGQDKIARLNTVSAIFQEGRVWLPETSWAQELMDEIVDFPNGENDDCVDATTLALMRFRNGGFLRLETDYQDEEDYYPKVRAYY